MAISPNRSPASISETTVSRLSTRVGDRDRHPALQDDVDRLGGSPALNRTSPRTRLRSCRSLRSVRGRRRCVREEICLGEDLGVVSHVPGAPYYPPAACPPRRRVDLVVGGGSGDRFGSAKQYERIGEARIIDMARAAAKRARMGSSRRARRRRRAGARRRRRGHAKRRVRNGLAAVPADADIICVHDAARPLATSHLFRSVIAAVASGADGAVPGVPVTDTIKMVDRDGRRR